MEKDDLTADLSARLHQQGVTFDSKTLNAFVSQVEPGQAEDAETLLDRYMEARNAHVRAVRKAYYAGHAAGFGFLVCALSLIPLGCGGFLVLGLLQGEHAPDAPGAVFVFLFGIFVAAAGAWRAITSTRTMLAARREAEEAFRRKHVI